MRPVRWFVKRVNTTYCACLLGHSQDVGNLCKNCGRQKLINHELIGPLKCVARAFSPCLRTRLFCSSLLTGHTPQMSRRTGRWEAVSFNGLPVHRQKFGRVCCLPAGCEKAKLPNLEQAKCHTRTRRFAAATFRPAEPRVRPPCPPGSWPSRDSSRASLRRLAGSIASRCRTAFSRRRSARGNRCY